MGKIPSRKTWIGGHEADFGYIGRIVKISKRPFGPSFTLVELLVVISIIGLLAGLSIPAISKARQTASRGVSAGNLKNFSTAMLSYAADNGGSLPGGNTTLSGISPIAKASAANSLQVQLMDYLDKSRPSGNNWGTYFLKSLSYPTWLSFNKGTNDRQIPAYIACQDYPDEQGGTFSPFGGGKASNSPMRLAQLSFQGTNRPYAVIECDQKLYNSVAWNAPSWKANLPVNPLHGSVRNVLYFDGSVQAVLVNQAPYPW